MAELTKPLRAPSEDVPNVRWFTEHRLRCLILDAAREAKAPSTLSGSTLLRMLIDSKLAHSLSSEKFDWPEGTKPYAIYSLEFGDIPSISPIELLQITQASYWRTVICYFTALAYHELTTQEVPHHHVATLKEPFRRQQNEITPNQTANEKSTSARSMGSLLFRYQGVPYCVTQRDPALMPGIQSVRFSPSCLIRMTTLEQTLLDSLHKPWSCGGPSVIFEAWERGLPLLDDARLAYCLKMIGRNDFTRRTGYMLEQFGYVATDHALQLLLADAKAKVKRGTEPTLPLFPDVPSSHRNTTWGITA